LVAGYPPTIADRFNIGILHTSLDGREGHDRYAPCTVNQLLGKGYDYWALGHVHKREIVHDAAPVILFPGNLQGRHIREEGPKGCMLVSVEGDKSHPSISAILMCFAGAGATSLLVIVPKMSLSVLLNSLRPSARLPMTCPWPSGLRCPAALPLCASLSQIKKDGSTRYVYRNGQQQRQGVGREGDC
jgi:hypothetical protein